MAFNPLQQRMADQGQTPASRGMSASEAQNAIGALLDDEGRSPGHQTLSDEEERQRGAADDQVLDEREDETPRADPNPDDQDDTDDGDTAEAEGDEGADEAEDEGQNDKADDENEDSGTIETLAELAEALEMEPDALLTQLNHTFKAAGEDHTVTLADLVAGYQLKADYDRDKTAMAEHRRAFEAEQTARMEQYQQNSNVLAQQFGLVEQTLASRMQDPALLELQRNDPASYLVQVRDIEQQVNQLRNARQIAAQQYQQFMDDERQAFMQAEGRKLQTEVEGWNDDKLKASVDTIKTLGFDDTEVVNIIDSRLIKGALELASLRTEVAALKKRIAEGDKAAGKVKKTVPKGIKPGKVPSKRGRGVDRSAVSKARRSHGQNKTVSSAAKVIEALME